MKQRDEFIHVSYHSDDIVSSTVLFILPSLSLVGMPWGGMSSHPNTASQRGIRVRCTAAVDT
jgi:hypothetical protein